MYIDGSIRKYLDDLAARKPAPGGGSAAALNAAVGVSLMSMVANYTVGSPKYRDVASGAADILVKCENFRNELQAAIDRDVEAYDRLSAALKKDKKDPETLKAAYKHAVQPPFDVCRICGDALALCRELAEIGNRNLITDTAIAAIVLEGAFFSAKFNVYINLKYIADMDYVGEIHNVLAPLEKKLPALREEIVELCEGVIQR